MEESKSAQSEYLSLKSSSGFKTKWNTTLVSYPPVPGLSMKLICIFLLGLLISPNAFSAQNSCNYDDAELYSGWGWDPINAVSCPPLNGSAELEPTLVPEPVADKCDYSNAAINSGWGWNTARAEACPPLVGTVGKPDADGCDYSGADNNQGWGWNAALKESCPPKTSAKKQEYNSRGSDKNVLVLLFGGQSNALGERTAYDAELDAPIDNLIAWTSDNGWQKADLCTQIWDQKWYPAAGGACSNHPAFQAGKSLALINPDVTVAIIPTGSAGQKLSHWDNGADGLKDFHGKATTALNALQHKDKVDLIAFAQGEADDGNSAWLSQLMNLIERTREMNWFEGGFVVSETFKSDVNAKLRSLRQDGDPLTDFVSSEGLSTKDGVHWSGADLRQLGKRFADKFAAIIDDESVGTIAAGL